MKNLNHVSFLILTVSFLWLFPDEKPSLCTDSWRWVWDIKQGYASLFNLFLLRNISSSKWSAHILRLHRDSGSLFIKSVLLQFTAHLLYGLVRSIVWIQKKSACLYYIAAYLHKNLLVQTASLAYLTCFHLRETEK